MPAFQVGRRGFESRLPLHHSQPTTCLVLRDEARSWLEATTYLNRKSYLSRPQIKNWNATTVRSGFMTSSKVSSAPWVPKANHPKPQSAIRTCFIPYEAIQTSITGRMIFNYWTCKNSGSFCPGPAQEKSSRPNWHGGTYIRKAKPSTVFHYFRAVRRPLNWAVEEGYLESSTISLIRFKPPSPSPVQAYSRGDFQRLLAVCDLDIKSGAYCFSLNSITG